MATNNKNFEDSLLEDLKDSEFAAEFIREALEEPGEGNDEVGYLMRAIGQVAKAHGIETISEKAGVPKPTIYKMIGDDPNPTLKNVLKITRAIGLRLEFTPEQENMEPADALDVAAYIVEKTRAKAGKDTFWLQKIVYYSQVTSLVSFNRRLFSQPIEAWANGPVVRDLFEKHRGIRNISKWSLEDIGNPENLGRDQRLAIDWTLDKYGDSTGDVLSDLTHIEDPWKLARQGLAPDDRSNQEITVDSIIEYYTNRPDYSDMEG